MLAQKVVAWTEAEELHNLVTWRKRRRSWRKRWCRAVAQLEMGRRREKMTP